MAELLTPERFLECVKQKRTMPGLYEFIFTMTGNNEGAVCCSCIHEIADDVHGEVVSGNTQVRLLTSADIDPEYLFCDICGRDMSEYAE